MSESEAIDEKHGPHTAINVGLVIVGTTALAVLLYFNGRFGWSLGTTEADRYAYVTLHILADLASAGLVAWSAAIVARGAWRWRWRALGAFLCALAFTSVSILTVYGFMSTRMAAVQGHAAVLEAQKGTAEWMKQQTVNPQVAEAYATAAAECATGRGPRCLAAEARAEVMAKQQVNMGKELSQQFKQIEATASIVPDSHALALASITGWSLETVQKALMLIMSAFGQCVKFACLFFGIKGLSQSIGRSRRSIAGSPELSPRSVSSSPKGSSGDGGSDVKSTEESKDKQPAREAEIHRFPARSDQLQPPPKVSAEPPRVPAPAPRPPVPLSLQPRYASVEDFLAMHPSVTSQKVIADAMGVSQAKVSRDIKRLKGRGKVKLDRNWRSNAVTFTPRRNGGLHSAVI